MRVLACIDPVPAPDGTCAQAAFIEQPSWIDYLPTVEQANEIGVAVFTSLMILAVARKLLFPPEAKEIT